MTFLELFKSAILAPTFVAVSFISPVAAESVSRARIPPDAVAPTPESLFRMFANRTADWGGGSAAFWDADGTFRSVNQGEQSLGQGKWYVTTASRMCYEGTWAWRQDFGVETRDVETCTRYLIDKDGQVWSTTETMAGPWFPFFDDNLSAGDNVSPAFSAMARTLGLVQRPARN